MLQIHHHRPGCAKEALSLWLGYSLDGFSQLLFAHHATRLTVSLA